MTWTGAISWRGSRLELLAKKPTCQCGDFSSTLSLAATKTNRVSPKIAPERKLEIPSPDRADWQRQPEGVRRFGRVDRTANSRALCAGDTSDTAAHPTGGAGGVADDKRSKGRCLGSLAHARSPAAVRGTELQLRAIANAPRPLRWATAHTHAPWRWSAKHIPKTPVFFGSGL